MVKKDVLVLNTGSSGTDFQFFDINPRYVIFLAAQIGQTPGLHSRVKMFVRDMNKKTLTAIDFSGINRRISGEQDLLITEVVRNVNIF